MPRIDDGALGPKLPLTLERFERWRGAHIVNAGRPTGFYQLYSHWFFEWDQDAMIGEQMRRFMSEVLEFADRSGNLKIHFATAREAFNMAMAAVDGRSGNPHEYRDYRLREIMREGQLLRNPNEMESAILAG